MRILVVDDDQDLNRLMCLFLEKHGYVVHAAADGLQAIDALERFDDVGLAIVDMNMPHVDGLELVKQLKGHPRHKDVPVIMISASSDEQKVEQSMRSGAGLFLAKPVNFDQLLGLVRFAG